MTVKDIVNKIKSYSADVIDTTKNAAIYASGTTILTNEAYEQYERVSGNTIIKRDGSGNPLVSPKTGQYLLDPPAGMMTRPL